MTWTVSLDNPDSIKGRTELPLNTGPFAVQQAGIDFGDSMVEAFKAQQLYGEVPTTYRVPNRMVTIPVGIGVRGTPAGEEIARRQLQQKIALFQRQGGVLLRRRGNALAVNLVLTPSFEYGTTGWLPNGTILGVGSGAALTRVTTAHFSGTAALQIVTKAEANQGAEFLLPGTFKKGVAYTASIYTKSATGLEKLRLRLGLGPEVDVASVKYVPGAGEWLRHSVTWTPSADRTGVSIVLSLDEEAIKTINLDAVQVSQSGEAITYADGDLAGYFWNGEAGNSTTGTGNQPLYADIVNASLTLPDVLGEGAGVEPNAVLHLECLPDFYGGEIGCDRVEGTGQVVGVVERGGKPFVVPGDYPARARLLLTDTSGKDQRSMLWGLASRHYSAVSTAALFFDAYNLTQINGATFNAEAAAFSGKVAELPSGEQQVGLWQPFLTTDTTAPSVAQLTHIGSYRVWARIKASAVGQQVRFSWGNDDATASTVNEQRGLSEGWNLVDLGEIRIEEPPVGEHWWRGVLALYTLGQSTVLVDRIWLQPLDDGAGKLRATAVATGTLLQPTKPATKGESTGERSWENPSGPTEAGGVAQVGLTSGKTSAPLNLTELGFALSSATVLGIIVTAPMSFTTGNHVTVSLLKAGAPVGAPEETYTSSGYLEPQGFGAANSLWGTTWTAAQINAANFGVQFVFHRAVGTGISYAKIGSYVTIQVFYTTSGLTYATDAILYANRITEIRSEGSYREDTTSSAYVRVSEETGALVRVPPSGLEGQPVELFVKNSRGLLASPSQNEGGEADSGIDKLQAQVILRPAYIGRL